MPWKRHILRRSEAQERRHQQGGAPTFHFQMVSKVGVASRPSGAFFLKAK